MSRFSDAFLRGPLGVTRLEAERLQQMLEPGEQLRFVFEADTKLNSGRFLADMFLKGAANVTGRIWVVITDRSVLLVDIWEQLFGEKGDRVLYADLPLPPTFGPVSGRGWIVLNRQPMCVLGGRKVLERAEAALKAPPGRGLDSPPPR